MSCFAQALIGTTSKPPGCSGVRALRWPPSSRIRCKAVVCRVLRSLPETFYGLLASEVARHGTDCAQGRESVEARLECTEGPAECPCWRWRLSEIGQTKLADEALRHQAKIGDSAPACQSRATGRFAQPRVDAVLDGALWPFARPSQCDGTLSDAQLGADRRLAGDTFASLRPRIAGIGFPHRRHQPGGRARPHAGPSRHRAGYGPRTGHFAQAIRTRPACRQPRIWPVLPGKAARYACDRRTAAEGHRRL